MTRRKRKTRIANVVLDAELYDRFKQAFPMHGSVSWFVRESMEYFLRELADDPPSALMRSAGLMRQDLTGRSLADNIVRRAEAEARTLIHGAEEDE